MNEVTSLSQSLGTVDIAQEHRIGASREVVFDALTRRIGDWWSPAMRVLDEGSTVSIDAQPGGMVGETLPNGDFAAWGTVTVFSRNEELRWAGQMGMGEASYNLIRFELKDWNGGTVVHFSHSGFGRFSTETQQMYGGGWSMLLGQLKAIAEE